MRGEGGGGFSASSNRGASGIGSSARSERSPPDVQAEDHCRGVEAARECQLDMTAGDHVCCGVIRKGVATALEAPIPMRSTAGCGGEAWGPGRGRSPSVGCRTAWATLVGGGGESGPDRQRSSTPLACEDIL